MKLSLLYWSVVLYLLHPSHASPTPVSSRDFQTPETCRCFPGDACWPSALIWSAFNHSIGGRLIATTPLAAPCHDELFGPFDASECTRIRDSWFSDQLHLQSSSSPMAPLFARDTCTPFSPREFTCRLGGLVSYAVNATGEQDYIQTLEFVRRHNIRLVIRNTGHDYLGKSTGPGAVALWTHFLKDQELKQVNTSYYSGPAIKVGAGIEVHEAYKFAHQHNLVVVGGNVPTVGLAGGFTQGGGHGPLASLHGLAADQALEWEVVTSENEIKTASPTHNEDLYWALSGGGGGSFAVIRSLTIKAHPQVSIAAANITFANTGDDRYWEAISALHQLVPSLGRAGASAAWFISTAATAIGPIYAPNLSQNDLDTMLAPILEELTRIRVEFAYESFEFADFFSGYQAMSAPIQVANLQIGGRLIPQELVENNNQGLTEAVRLITTAGAVFAGTSYNVSRTAGPANAVNPYFRRSVFGATVGTGYNYTDPALNTFWSDKMTDEFLPALAALTPDGGVYLNEADFRQPDFEQLFYGANYGRLDSIKAKYDPGDVLYARTGVGSRRWEEREDGRLCQVLG